MRDVKDAQLSDGVLRDLQATDSEEAILLEGQDELDRVHRSGGSGDYEFCLSHSNLSAFYSSLALSERHTVKEMHI